MRFIEPIEELYGLVPLYTPESIFPCLEFMEKCGRVCYKSEERITKDSCIEFTNKILNRGHLTVIEHSNLVVYIECGDQITLGSAIDEINSYKSDFMRVGYNSNGVFVGANLRAWMEQLRVFSFDDIFTNIIEWMGNIFHPDLISFVSENKEIPSHLRRYTVKFINDRAFSHELVRHRLCVFSQESQRYVRYDDGIVFITPYQYRNEDGIPERFVNFVQCAVDEYGHQLNVENLPPELARTCLPNCTKTEVVTTADYAEWEHIFKLRFHVAAHPDMQTAMGNIIDIVKTAILAI